MEEKKEVKRKPRLQCNLSGTKYEVVRHVLEKKMGFKVSLNEEEEESDLYWTDTAVPPEKLARMKPYQKINHFPGMYALARKNYLAWNIGRMYKHFPEDYNIAPRTWVLPADYSDFKAQFAGKKKKTYILKPEASCQGRGIFLIKRIEEISSNDRYVAQEYLDKPLLIENLKFDLRIYVLVAGCDPLRIFVHRDGLARFATEEYEPPHNSNIEEMCMHLTNYAINKNNPNFVFNEDSEQDDVGHKRSLKSTLDCMRDEGYDVDKLWEDIKDIIIKTLCSAQPSLAHVYKSCQPDDPHNGMCFELLGFDIILDDDCKPWLLEVNHTPSFTTDSPLDWTIKKNVITDVIKLLNIKARNRRVYFNKLKADIQKRALTGRKTKESKEEREEMYKKAQAARDRWECKHLGGFEKIYPADNKEKYDQYLKVAYEIWQDWTGGNINRVRKTEKEPEKLIEVKKPKTMKVVKSNEIKPRRDNRRLSSQNSTNLISEDAPPVQQPEQSVYDRLYSGPINKLKSNIVSLPPKIPSQDSSKELPHINPILSRPRPSSGRDRFDTGITIKSHSGQKLKSFVEEAYKNRFLIDFTSKTHEDLRIAAHSIIGSKNHIREVKIPVNPETIFRTGSYILPKMFDFTPKGSFEPVLGKRRVELQHKALNWKM